jgi:hypothetical protein
MQYRKGWPALMYHKSYKRKEMISSTGEDLEKEFRKKGLDFYANYMQIKKQLQLHML